MGASGFTAVIKIGGVNPFILVSTLRANAIKPGWRKPLPVLVRQWQTRKGMAHKHDAGTDGYVIKYIVGLGVKLAHEVIGAATDEGLKEMLTSEGVPELQVDQ